MTELLSDRVAALDDSCNLTDVLVEVALFEQDDDFTSVRPNAAGTKVIYRHKTGETTCWAYDWTINDFERANTVAALKARGL